MGSMLLLVAGILIVGGIKILIKKTPAKPEDTKPTKKEPLTSTQPQSTQLEGIWANPALGEKLAYDLFEKNFEAAFEARETGYKAAMEKVFAKVIHYTGPIDVLFIQELHRLAMTDLVMHEEKNRIKVPGHFSLESTCIRPRFTTDVLEEYIKLSLRVDQRIRIHHYGTGEDKTESELKEMEKQEETSTVDTEYITTLTDNSAPITYCVRHNHNPNDQAPYKDSLATCIKQFLTEYHDEMKQIEANSGQDDAKQQENKLKCICKLIQQLERLHPFPDGNGRVFRNALLNHLLKRNEFPPALQDNPAHTEMYTLDQYCHDIHYSMKKASIFQRLYEQDPDKADYFFRKTQALAVKKVRNNPKAIDEALEIIQYLERDLLATPDKTDSALSDITITLLRNCDCYLSASRQSHETEAITATGATKLMPTARANTDPSLINLMKKGHEASPALGP